MPTLSQRCCLLLLALPAIALAEPVTVTTHATGTADPDYSVLAALGMEYSGVAALPYELTLTSTFDPVTVRPAREDWASDAQSDVVIDFRLGTMDFHYAGNASADAVLYTSGSGRDGYQHDVALDSPVARYSLRFRTIGLGIPGSFGAGGALDPLSAGDGAGFGGYLEIAAYPANPDAPGSWYMLGDATRYSVQVSAVPEPASWAMLAGGLSLLSLLGARRRRGAPAGAAPMERPHG